LSKKKQTAENIYLQTTNTLIIVMFLILEIARK